MRMLKVDRFTVFLAVASAVGAALVLSREATYGVSLHWDGINYIAVARNILDGDILRGLNEHPFTRWPPLYPILLAMASLFVFDPYDVAGPFSAALFGLTIFISGLWMRRRLASRFLVIWGFLALMLSIPLTWMATWALSEPLFILMVVLALVRIDEFLIEGKSSSLIWAAVFTAMACLTRWTGVTVIMAILPLLVLQRGVKITEKTKRITLYSAISVLPVGLYMFRNELLVGHPTGNLKPPINSLDDTIDAVLGAIGRWIFPDLSWETSETIPQLLAGVLLAALVVAVVYLVLLGQRKTNIWSKWGSLSVFGGFVVAYVIFFLSSAVVVGGTEIDTSYRYFTVIFAPFLIAFVLVIDRLSSYIRLQSLNELATNLPMVRNEVRITEVGTFIFIAVMAIPLCLWLAHTILLNIHAINLMNESGLHPQNYANLTWRDSEVLEYLREAPSSGQIISNVNVATYIFVGGPAMHWSLSNDMEGLKRQIQNADDGSYVAYFKDWYKNHTFRYGVFNMARLLEPVANLRDGFVFKVNRAYSANPTPLLRTPDVEPDIRSVYDLYLDDGKLIYVKEPCSVQDIESKFFLHVYPVDAYYLSDSRKQHRFENFDFYFSGYGERHNDKCQIERWLPEYDISRVITGQFISGQGQIWRAEIRIGNTSTR